MIVVSCGEFAFAGVLYYGWLMFTQLLFGLFCLLLVCLLFCGGVGLPVCLVC